jgi:RHH-type proline utilization regulon transcriptional repressor/proline dehydrogenase/delta 1-pyrroline-5-carboxylate dehydrogenase
MLKGAMQELRVGNPAELRTDVGPVITAEAAERISDHIEAKRKLKHRITQSPVADGRGTFVPPTLIELDRIEQLKQEVFGPVLHVVRYARQDLDRVIDEVNALGFGLTFGLHTRLDETIDRVTSRIHAGNIYVNRNIIGAVVGVQPFGGQGMSGTGPKAGGPLYLRRLVRQRPADNDIAELLPGPVGESNLYRTAPRGEILLLPQTREGLSLLLDAVAATRNAPVIDAELVGAAVVRELAPQARLAAALANEASVDGVLVEGGPERVASIARQVAEFAGRIIPVQSAADVNRDMLVHEISVSINTAAAGGNASLMALAER